MIRKTSLLRHETPCLPLKVFKLLNKREERSDNVGKTLVNLGCVVITYLYGAFNCMFLSSQMVVKFWLDD